MIGPKTVLLIGPPGSGKSTMACLTAVKKPVHALDIDRKLKAMASFQNNFDKGLLTSWELEETIAEESLATRLQKIAKNEKPSKEPQGWNKFAAMVEKLTTADESKRAGTWYIGSLTLLSAHLVQAILFHDKVATALFSPREYQYFLNVWHETITVIIDTAKANGKDLIVDVHERVTEIPNDNAKVMYSGSGATRTREVIGTLDMKMWASIPGQFGGHLGSYFEEVYGMNVVVTNGKPTWKCRLDPDGKRDLRCTFTHKESDVEPDFRKIWGMAETINP